MDWERFLGGIQDTAGTLFEGYTQLQIAEIEAERERYAPRPDPDRTSDRTETTATAERMIFGVNQSTLILGGLALLGVAIVLRNN